MGISPKICFKSGLSHENSLILPFPSLCVCCRRRHLPFSCLCDLRFICLPKGECIWSCCNDEYFKMAHYDPALRSHLFSHHVHFVSQVNCRHYSSAVCVIYLYSKSTQWVVNVHSQSFLSWIFTHSTFSPNPVSPPVIFIQLGATLTVWLAEWMVKITSV